MTAQALSTFYTLLSLIPARLQEALGQEGLAQEGLVQEGLDPEAKPSGGLSGLFGSSYFPFILIGLIVWFVLIAPERKNRRKREELLAALKKGDEIVLNSGLYGTIVQFQGDQVVLQVDDKVRLRFSRAAIQGLARPTVEASKEAAKDKESDKPDAKAADEQPAKKPSAATKS